MTLIDSTTEPPASAKTVLFVCHHGAGKSRMAAAYFTSAAPPGWAGTTAGLHPGDSVSPAAVRLLAGSAEEQQLDREAPRSLAAVPQPELVVSIDCDAAAEMPAAEGATTRHLRWTLAAGTMDETMRDELRARALDLAAALRDTPQAPTH